jgi:membrane protease YdiL (CAAX protease family)
MLLGLLVPFMISLFMIFTSKNVALKSDFINRLVNLRLIQPKVLPVFVFLMPVSVLIAIAISLLCGGSVSQLQFAKGFSFSGFIPVLLLLMLAALFEELGWRGYAFDSLQSKYTYFKASIIFSVLWSLWHFPLIFVNNSYQYEVVHQNVWFGLNFFVSIIPMGIIISWICIKNNKSILAAIIFHFITNISQEMFAITQCTKCIQTFVLTVIAIGIIVVDKKLFFSSKHLLTSKIGEVQQ